MDDYGTNRMKGLSARQHDCLRLISSGHDIAGMCTALGITKSTGEKHLAAARRALQVSSTVDAVVQYMSYGRNAQLRYQRMIDTCLTGSEKSNSLTTLANKLSDSASLDEAWNCFHSYLCQLGFEQSILGLIAEPFGHVTTGARLLKSSFPLEFMDLYDLSGGAAVDPIARRISACKDSFLSDERKIAKMQFDSMPRNIRHLTEMTSDLNLEQLLVVPGRDELTDAPYCISVRVDSSLRNVSDSDFEKITSGLFVALDMFWRVCRRNKLLSPVSELTARQKKALSFAARGFRIDEAAEHLNVSLAGAQKLLSNARQRLNAPTTPAAIYRAMVYGAL